MRLLVLDFDGVISDSAPEAFAVALRAYVALCPGAIFNAADRALYERFLEMMPLGNRAEDYAVCLAAIEQELTLPDQIAYDAFRASQDPKWLRRYHVRFYEERAAWSHADPAGWRAALRPYTHFADLLRRRAGARRYAIATAKDRRSVTTLLRDYDLDALFEPELELDKETGVSKRSHHEMLARLTGVDYSEMTFLDDKVNHLDGVADLGVRCALSGWGYNGPREHALARARGYPVCTPDDAERQLFGCASS